MFEDACERLLHTVLPVISAYRTRRGKVSYSIGAFMILNEDGWIITASHILKTIMATHEEVSRNNQPGVGAPKRRSTKRKGGSSGNPNDKMQCAVIWGSAGGQIVRGQGDQQSDLAAGLLGNFTLPEGYQFPVFRRDGVRPGEFLCRVGYPFVPNVTVTWSQDQGFTFNNLFPVPTFVNEALVSRFAELSEGKTWIETSSPGLRGQSGGPLADRHGTICGVQTNTEHYPLDFEGRGKGQVLNVGRAVHVDTIRRFLTEHDIAYRLEEGA